jgi:phage terminase small subunit
MAKELVKGQYRPLKNWKAVVDAWVLDPDRNKTNAYLTVSSTTNRHAAQTASSRLFMQPEVIEYVNMRLEQLAEIAEKKFALDAESLIELLSNMVTYDPRKLAGKGTLKDLKEFGDAEAMALEGFDVIESESAGTVITKLKFAKRYDGIEKLMKYLGMYEKDNKQKADGLADVLAEIAGNGPGPLG